jgi:threonine dehydrogenase-like Zn-dependent dehydrogenase
MPEDPVTPEGASPGCPVLVIVDADDQARAATELVDTAAALGVHTRPSSETYELAIIGAGPAGLAVNAAQLAADLVGPVVQVLLGPPRHARPFRS